MTKEKECICSSENEVRKVLCPVHGVVKYQYTTQHEIGQSIKHAMNRNNDRKNECCKDCSSFYASDGQIEGCLNPYCPCHQKKVICCQKCECGNRHLKMEDFTKCYEHSFTEAYEGACDNPDCPCHLNRANDKEGWEEVYQERFGYMNNGGFIDMSEQYRDIKDFIRQTLAVQQEEFDRTLNSGRAMYNIGPVQQVWKTHEAHCEIVEDDQLERALTPELNDKPHPKKIEKLVFNQSHGKTMRNILTQNKVNEIIDYLNQQ